MTCISDASWADPSPSSIMLILLPDCQPLFTTALPVCDPAIDIIISDGVLPSIPMSTIVTAILINNIMISTKAICDGLRPKKMNDHRTFD